MKRELLMLIALTGGIFSSQALSIQYSEKAQYLGTLNGQRQGDGVIKVMRTLTEPVLFQVQGETPLPTRLLVRGAQMRQASGGMLYITVSQALPEGRVARMTIKTTLMVDARRIPLSAEQRGEDVVIAVPEATNRVELRTDTTAELEVSANYRGELRLALEVTSEI
ncbi:DUF5462 family protein [Aeromonas hydrophila]|uniref:DUF5462 family protein n=1 Tax=Aeromonas hydrophila TaxID=644 RepID=UPI0038D09E81